MRTNLYFTIPTITDEYSTSTMPYTLKYDYWQPLVNYFIPKADTIEIHCWTEEEQILTELNNFFHGDGKIEENLAIFKGNLNLILEELVANHFSGTDSTFKWFTLNLLQSEILVFHSGHWATEFFVPEANDKEWEQLVRIMPKGKDWLRY
ncbi:hypothetical protein AM500_12165 [Bacillus sp. FJAT-18017]|uniref:hypothetical protein n=1 Tax=Bacillus sp. FJAT-18017 TaxID=1705566 RepID=UPI0006AE7E27|nr:hypothetical protein [Bacillus sp. FJAT-18017]ALC90456.1 hypothetical protein AM500_12165 [Bacillus sp. FJAT-18017]